MAFIRVAIMIAVFTGILLQGAAMADRVVAVVDGQKIMESELEEFTEKMPAPFRDAFKKKALQQMIDARLFYTLGRQAGLLDSEEYQKKIDRASQMIVSDLFVEKKIKPEINVTDQDVQTFYRENKDRYNTKTRILPGHILAKNKNTAQSLRKKIDIEGFDTVADSLPKEAKDIGYFMLKWTQEGKTQMPAAFENAAFALKKGGVSPVVETSIGYHIIKVFDRKPGQKKTFDQVKNTIKAQLSQEKLATIKQRYHDAANIEILAEEYR